MLSQKQIQKYEKKANRALYKVCTMGFFLASGGAVCRIAFSAYPLVKQVYKDGTSGIHKEIDRIK